MDFTPSIQAVRKSDSYNYWTTLPSNKYYLTAIMHDIKKTIDRLRNSRPNSRQLTKSQAWAPFKRDTSLSYECAKRIGRRCELT